MNAVSRKPALCLRLIVASAASVWVLEAPGCSGTVVTSHASRADDGGLGAPSISLGGSGNAPGRRGTGGGSMGGGTSPGGPLCGNGVVDPGEVCDGANLRGQTCYYATMGSLPSGTLGCTGCTFDVSGCYGGVGGQAG